MRPHSWPATMTLGAMLVAAGPVHAQTPGAPPPRSDRPRWELEAYGGVSLGRRSSGGSLVLPEPGAPIATSSPIFPSWRVPSWYFGDGAAFLNNVAEEFGVAARILPLDSALGPSGMNDLGSVPFGVRVRRPWRGRFALEVGVELRATPAGLSGALVDAVETARLSFQDTVGALLLTGPFSQPSTTTTSTLAKGSSREVALTGAVIADLADVGGFRSFVLAGGGVIGQMGTPPSVSLTGSYRFLIDGAPIEETDRLTLRYGQRTALVAALGGGLRRALSPRLDLRLDARVLVGPSTTRVAIDADPTRVTGTPARFIESFTYPNLQFSNNASTGRESTLSGTLNDFQAFTGGWQTRVRVTVGLVAKF